MAPAAWVCQVLAEGTVWAQGHLPARKGWSPTPHLLGSNCRAAAGGQCHQLPDDAVAAAWQCHRCLLVVFAAWSCHALPGCAIHCLVVPSLPAGGIVAWLCHLLLGSANRCLVMPPLPTSGIAALQRHALPGSLKEVGTGQ